MTKRDKQAEEYAAESYGKGDKMRGDSDTDRCASRAMSDTEERLTEYCLHGGLYNPELMQHDKVRELLIDCRDEIARLRLTDEERWCLKEMLVLIATGHEDHQKEAFLLRDMLRRSSK